MSMIIGVGGGGGGGGLTEDEVNTLIGRGAANGTAGLDSSKNLLVPWNSIKLRNGTTPSDLWIYSGGEAALKIGNPSDGKYDGYFYDAGVTRKILDDRDRNGATPAGVAGIYNPCKTILNEHRPVCTKEYHLTGKYLDGADNPDVWFPIKGAGVGASVSYANRVLTLKSGTGAISASRCVIDQTKFPITGNFLEVTFELDHVSAGEGGRRSIAVGFQSAFSKYEGPGGIRATVEFDGIAWWFCPVTNSVKAVDSPIGRNLQSGDIVTIRLDRQEGSPNIDIVRFYVNGQKQYESTSIPAENVYAGIGVFNTNSLVDVSPEIGIKYFGVRYVP